MLFSEALVSCIGFVIIKRKIEGQTIVNGQTISYTEILTPQSYKTQIKFNLILG